MTLTPSVLQMLVAKAHATRADEMTCGDCEASVDRFAEMKLAGLDTADALPLVEEHLSNCSCCGEEFDALMEVLRTAEQSERPWWRRVFG